uniref:Myocyte enhancer factor n=1 Tax=Sphaerodactylus townsendi TaxID=933632 RepID=A0ACB8E6P4_9SAUR
MHRKRGLSRFSREMAFSLSRSCDKIPRNPSVSQKCTVETLRKKGLNGCESPDADDYFEHSPLSEDRFSKLNEDSDFIFKRGPPGLPQQNFSMSVTVPVSSPNTLTYSNPGSSLVSPALAASSTLTDATMLSPPQASLHRNVSPGGPQRPPSTGSAGGMLSTADLSVPNGAGSSPVVAQFSICYTAKRHHQNL